MNNRNIWVKRQCTSVYSRHLHRYFNNLQRGKSLPKCSPYQYSTPPSLKQKYQASLIGLPPFRLIKYKPQEMFIGLSLGSNCIKRFGSKLTHLFCKLDSFMTPYYFPFLCNKTVKLTNLVKISLYSSRYVLNILKKISSLFNESLYQA